MEKIKAKGIPHPSGPFPYGEEIDIEACLDKMTDQQVIEWGDKKELLERVQAWLLDPHHLEPPVEAIGQKFYMWRFPEESEAYFAKHLNRNMIKLMMTGQGMFL